MERLALHSVRLEAGSRTILRDVTFAAAEKEFVAVLGRNGAGKTTLLRAIGGLHSLAAGTLRIGGVLLTGMRSQERARAVAFTSGEQLPSEAMAVREAVANGRFAHHRWWDWRFDEADVRATQAALSAVDLLEFGERELDTLSSGERQRVWLAVALAQEAPLLLADEPTSHLDVRYRRDVLQVLRRLADGGQTVVAALHDPNEALQYADCVVVLADGECIASGSPGEILTAELLGRAYGASFERIATPRGPRLFWG